jgi:RNA polymerase sigma factor for flagellar operon FliA
MVDLAVGLALGYMLEDTGIFRGGNAVAEDSTYKTHHMNELRNRLRHIVEVLPEREQLMIRYHYYHNVGFDQIAEMLEISKGRVSQLHKKALKLIKEAMLGFRELDGYY